MQTIGCVSYLNARPLTDGLDRQPGLRLALDVPSRLLAGLTEGTSSIALCPTIDYQTAPRRLRIVPVGGIGCNGETLTVRVFARRPLPEVRRIVVDGDSRTSAALLQVVFHRLFGGCPPVETWTCNQDLVPEDAEAVLLIGDKVVTRAPDPARFPHQLDLGAAWKQISGQPFLFAVWMAREDADLDGLPGLLLRTRDRNRRRIPEIVVRHAAGLGWPLELAEHYLGSLLRYEVGHRELKAMTSFWSHCHELGLIDELRPLRLYGEQLSAAS